jgi:heme oxygenase
MSGSTEATRCHQAGPPPNAAAPAAGDGDRALGQAARGARLGQRLLAREAQALGNVGRQVGRALAQPGGDARGKAQRQRLGVVLQAGAGHGVIPRVRSAFASA